MGVVVCVVFVVVLGWDWLVGLMVGFGCCW